MYLHEFRGHENLPNLLELIGGKDDNDIWLVFDFVGADLRAVTGRVLSETHRKYVTSTLRTGAAFRQGNSPHVKPSNILIDENCHVAGDLMLQSIAIAHWG